MLENSAHILAIESGILGGSIAYFRKGELADCLIGKNETSRAEDLVSDVNLLLSKNGVDILDVDLIAVSRGPGSYTGIRIGLSSALGLSSGSNCPIVGVALLQAIHVSITSDKPRLILLPFGKNEFAWQLFNAPIESANTVTAPSVEYLDNISELIAKHGVSEILCHSTLCKYLSAGNIQVIEFADCLASYVGNLALVETGCFDLTPIYSVNPEKRSALY